MSILNLKNKIICGESVEELKKIPSESFDLIFADPPYNLQLKNELTRPDRSKVNAVNDKWDKFKILKAMTNLHQLGLKNVKKSFKKMEVYGLLVVIIISLGLVQ